MKTLVAMATLAISLMIGSAANAAAVDIRLTQSGPTDWTLTADVAAGQTVGAIQLIFSGATTFAINTSLAGVSALDSAFFPDGLGDGTGRGVMNVVNSGTGVSLGGAGGPNPTTLLLGVLGGSANVTIEPGDAAFGSTVLDAAGNTVTDFSIVPEPGAMLLLGLGLAGLALGRRSA